MDTARLPAYRSSYLLRFHPYARVKPSVRERLMMSVYEDQFHGPPPVDALDLENDISSTLNQVMLGTVVHTDSRQRRLSVSSIVVDLALLFAKKASLQDHKACLVDHTQN